MAKSNLTKAQVHALKQAISKLDVNHPQFRGAAHVRASLSPHYATDNAGIYVHSWVIPLLEAVLNGESRDGSKLNDLLD